MKLDRETRNELIKLAAGTALFLLSFLTENFVHFALLACSYAVLGYEIVFEAFKNLFHGELLDENFLMAAATIAAALLGDYNEAVFVILFYSIGEFAQDLASDRSRDNIENLLDLTPEFIHVGNKDYEPAQVHIGTVFTVFPGERIPLDGIVSKGSAFLDTKSITGESVPVSCKVGNPVISGSIVMDSAIEIESTTEYENSTASRIMKLIECSEETKAPAEKFITKFAKYYTPIVVGCAVALAVIPSLFTGLWSKWVYRALNFMVISCPCALVLSIPLAFFAGIGGCASKGILVKGAEHLEQLAKTQAVVFDKTGTLTLGEFSVQKIHAENGFSKDDVSALAYALESSSKHPIAKAVLKSCNGGKKASDVHEISGMGMVGQLEGKQVLAGNDKLLKQNKIDFNIIDETGTIVYVAFNGIYAGFIAIGDTVKSEAETAISDLKKMGVKKTVMLSGDNEKTASSVADKIGLDSHFSNLLPDEKTNILRSLKNDYVCTYCGDGINDIPVMLEADCSVSMGTIGSDAAIEASGIVFTNDDLSKLPLALKKARKTMSIVRQNIIFSIACKAVCLLLGALGVTGLTLAIFADTGVALLAVLNSMRALN